jgi:hypothetical protein
MRTAGDLKPLDFANQLLVNASELRLALIGGRRHRAVPSRSCGITCNNFSKQLKA